jgi:hypothetical protein
MIKLTETREITSYKGEAFRTSLALAECLCRTADRIDPA